jgi:hypothetical protein
VRRVILLVSIVCFAALILLATLIYGASPGPASQEIHGVGIVSDAVQSGIVYLSGRRLDCERTGTQTCTSICTVVISGKPLEIRARRNPASDPNQLGGTCEAFYDGKQWPCSIGSRHVDVHWFAYIGEPLGLTGDQLKALRREHFFENLPEETFLTGLFAVPIVAMLVAGLATAVWLWPRARSRLSSALLVAASGLASLLGTFALGLLLTRGFWD